MLQLRQELDSKPTSQKRPAQFDAWIDMYSGEEFETEVKDYIAIVDKAAVGADGETVGMMKEHFRMCCQLEYMFWTQASELMGWPEFKE